MYSLPAQPIKLQFERISSDNGLSQSSVLCIYQDSKGFIWFGTYDGLNRYDGYEFKVYKTDPANPKSISSNSVECIFEDHQGNLWLGSSEGLNMFNRETEQFTRYLSDHNDPQSIGNNYIRYLYEDHTGTLWVATQGSGLNKLDKKTGKFEHYLNDPNNPRSIGHNNILSILEDKENNLWVGTDGGLCLLNRETNDFTVYKTDANDPKSISANGVWRLFEDSDGNLWVGTWGNGLNRFDRKNNNFIRYVVNNNNPNSLNHPVVRAIAEDNDGNLWIGTDGGGLNILPVREKMKKNPKFIHYVNNIGDITSLSGNQVFSLFKDKSGVMWVGTNFCGINKYNPGRQKFVNFSKVPNNENSLSVNTVSAVYEDKNGIIWLGTMGGGLNRFDRKQNIFTHYTNDLSDTNSISNNIIRSITEDKFGRLWIATDNGLNRFDRKTRHFTHYFPENNNPKSISFNTQWNLFNDREGQLWIATMVGLDKYDYEKDSFKHYLHDENNPNSISGQFIWSITQDKEGFLWFGTNEKGVNRFDTKRELFSVFKNNPADPASLSGNKVITLFTSQSGTIWVGTTDGLNKWDADKNKFVRYTLMNGLPNNAIQSMLEDEHGNLWIGTNNGLAKFNPVTESFRIFNKSDGLQGNEFGVNACYKLNSGEMIFGGTNGFNIFQPDSIKNDNNVPTTVITSFKIFNKTVPLGKLRDGRTILTKSITESKEITLSYTDAVISFEFAALHYASPQENHYAYMLEGFDKEWIYTDASRRFASYTNLNSGQYIFRVKASNPDEVWNKEDTSVKITIIPPFWATTWFRIIFIAFISLFFIIVYQIRTYTIRSANKQLENKVEERTKELMQSNTELEDKKNLLQTVINIIPDPIYLKDKMNRFILNNTAHIRLLGARKQEDVKGKTDSDIYPLAFSETNYEDEQKILTTGIVQLNKEEKFKSPIEGQQFWLTTTKARFKDSQGNVQGIVCISHDITERKLFEEELKQAKKDADLANRAKSEFLANMSHEIRTPMNGVIGMTELALDLAPNKQQRDYLKMAKQAAESLLDLVNDILDFSKIESGKLELEETDFALRDLVELAVSSFALRAQTKGLELLCDINQDVPFYLKGDPARLRQIIINLMGNAIKFTDKGEIIVRVNPTNTKIQNGSKLTGLNFSICDTGIGISKKKMKQIFLSFSQEDSSTTRKYGGTGLGLTISKRLCELMGGKIWVDSEKGKGSNFQFTVYMKEGKPIHEVDIKSYKELDFDNRRVLIVDDNETNCIIMEKIMELWHFKPHVCYSGRDALTALNEATAEGKPFALILLDYMMPEMDGFTFAKKVRANKNWDNIKIIMMSSINNENDSKKVKIESFLPKPIRQAELLQALEDTLGKVTDTTIPENDQSIIEDSSPGMDILLVEDNIINQKVAVNLLKKFGHKITVVEDGIDALEQLKQNEFDLILMDVQMPNMDGVEATKIIRTSESPKINSQIPIIAMTAHSMMGDRERFIAAGMDDYISKPIDMKKVIKIINNYAKNGLVAEN